MQELTKEMEAKQKTKKSLCSGAQKKDFENQFQFLIISSSRQESAQVFSVQWNDFQSGKAMAPYSSTKMCLFCFSFCLIATSKCKNGWIILKSGLCKHLFTDVSVWIFLPNNDSSLLCHFHTLIAKNKKKGGLDISWQNIFKGYGNSWYFHGRIKTYIRTYSFGSKGQRRGDKLVSD